MQNIFGGEQTALTKSVESGTAEEHRDNVETLHEVK
jgi:hypothetical protein